MNNIASMIKEICGLGLDEDYNYKNTAIATRELLSVPVLGIIAAKLQCGAGELA